MGRTAIQKPSDPQIQNFKTYLLSFCPHTFEAANRFLLKNKQAQ